MKISWKRSEFENIQTRKISIISINKTVEDCQQSILDKTLRWSRNTYSTSDDFIEFSIEREVQTIANVIDSGIKSLSSQKCFHKKVPKKFNRETLRILRIKLWTQGEKKNLFLWQTECKKFFLFLSFCSPRRRDEEINSETVCSRVEAVGSGWKAKRSGIVIVLLYVKTFRLGRMFRTKVSTLKFSMAINILDFLQTHT